jgi:leucyl aminopeptidase (aminopeptidase T)
LPAVPFAGLFAAHSLVVALTELSATAPLKVAARAGGFRAATMPGFVPEMIPALRLDYREINRHVDLLKELLDAADEARIVFRAAAGRHELRLDLRHRTAHASGGLLRVNGMAGNLPSGEAYIVPYEGERPDDVSRSAGKLPVQFGEELVVYGIERNRAVAVLSAGPRSDEERELIRREPAYANLAELGLGVLAEFGVEPVGSILLDEKLGLHVAFGRSDHFDGQVGPGDFSAPSAVVHLDRVYLPQTQPLIAVESLDLIAGSRERRIMREGSYQGVF